MLKKYGFAIIAIAALVIAVISFFPSSRMAVVGAIGTNAIENYVPAILYNEGYYSNLSIQTTGTSTSATTTTAQLTVSGNANITGTTTIASKYYSVNGVDFAAVQVSMNSASTTLCAIPEPWSATSTLVLHTVHISTGTSTASTIDVGASTNNTATTSALFVQSDAVASGAQDTIILPGALPTSATSTIISPGWNIVTKTNEVGVGGYTYGGTCNALFMKP